MNPERLIEGVHSLSEQLAGCAIPHAFGGAIAYGFYGTPRMTNDFDINVFLPEAAARKVFDCLEPLGVASGAEAMREVAANGQVRLNWQGTMVGLFFAYAPFHDAAAKRLQTRDLEGKPLRILSPEDITVFKVIFNRPHDWDDVRQMLIEQRDELDLKYVTKWLGEILGADDSRIQRLLEMAAEAREITG